MAIKTVPQKFETSDGKEFTSKADAERHDALMKAKQDFDAARVRVGKLLAESQKTADGIPFEFGLMVNYYYVTPGYASMPQLRTVSFWYQLEFDDQDEFVLYEKPDQGDERGRKLEFKISELYLNKHNAQVALLAAQELWLGERAAEVNDLRKELKGEK